LNNPKPPVMPAHKQPLQVKLLMYARELESQGFVGFELRLLEADGTRWLVVNTPKTQPVVTYLGATP